VARAGATDQAAHRRLLPRGDGAVSRAAAPAPGRLITGSRPGRPLTVLPGLAARSDNHIPQLLEEVARA